MFADARRVSGMGTAATTASVKATSATTVAKAEAGGSGWALDAPATA